MLDTIKFIVLGVIVLASIMEFIKYNFYKNEITKKQATLWALGLSAGLTPVLYYGFTLIGTPISMIIYFLILFVFQKEVNMEAVRPLIKKIIDKKLNEI